MTPSDAYKKAGVDIDAGEELVRRIAPLAKATARPGAGADLGGFGGAFDLSKCGYEDPILISGADGVGTKLKIAFETDRHGTVGEDLVAMCANDVLAQGAEPLFFLDYFASSALSVDVAATVVGGIAEGCRKAGCALIGGETAEMPGMYGKGEYDLAGFCVGAVERNAILPRTDICAGDVMLALPSSGLHSNGFSLVRSIVAQAGLDYDQPSPFSSSTLGEALLTPTSIYVRSVLPLMRAGLVKAAAHITGGGLTENVPRSLPDDLAPGYAQQPARPPVFDWLQSAGGLSDADMRRTFNNGVGFVVIVAEAHADEASAKLVESGEAPFALGDITAA